MTQTILVVDDSADFRRIVSRVLTSGGYKPLTAAGADEARQALAAAVPAAAILDWNLAGESGVELSQWMRSQPRLAALPVLIISVNALPEEQARGLREGDASAYMTKPFEPDELLARLRSLLARRARHGGLR